jgi:calcineurin-like phosphoesterase family protein
MIYVTSDLHLCHDKEFLYQPRGFDNVWDMNEAILENWNNLVEPEDDIYVLGDLMLKDSENGIKLIRQLKGNIHVVLGNHDTDKKIKLYNNCWNIVEIEYAMRLKYHKYHFFLTHYPCLTGNFDKEKPLKRRTINLCGHNHTQDCFSQWTEHPIFHVEMDTNNCTPWLLDDIIEMAEEREKARFYQQ